MVKFHAVDLICAYQLSKSLFLCHALSFLYRWKMRRLAATVGWAGEKDALFLESQPVWTSVPMLTKTLTT